MYFSLLIGIGVSGLAWAVWRVLDPVTLPRCWAAPHEAVDGTGEADGYWLFREGQPYSQPVYCVRWLGPWDKAGERGRPTIATRCWPALPMSDDACAQSPVR